jgi:hypothetical protein
VAPAAVDAGRVGRGAAVTQGRVAQVRLAPVQGRFDRSLPRHESVQKGSCCVDFGTHSAYMQSPTRAPTRPNAGTYLLVALPPQPPRAAAAAVFPQRHVCHQLHARVAPGGPHSRLCSCGRPTLQEARCECLNVINCTNMIHHGTLSIDEARVWAGSAIWC